MTTPMGFFHGSHDFVITGGTFIEVHGNYEVINTSVQDEIPPLLPLKQPSALFIGRDTYIQKLKDQFHPDANNMLIRRSFLLYGMGGVGKTQICLKFIEETEDWFLPIFWIDCSSESTITLSLAQIAKANDTGTEKSAVSSESALQWISGLKSNWLMVFDNADGGYEVVEKFIPFGKRGNILMTSRNPQLGRITSFENTLEVALMDEDDATSLLMKCGNLVPANKEISKRIVLALGCLPLAIDQAGAYMQASQCDPYEYLELFNHQQVQLLSGSDFKGASSYNHSAYSTWDISIKAIEAQAASDHNPLQAAAQSALMLHRVFAFFHNDSISHEIFHIAAQHYAKNNISLEEKKGLPLIVSLLDKRLLYLNKSGCWDKLQFQAGIQVLLSYSLIKCHKDLYSIHPLVHKWSRDSQSDINQIAYCINARAILTCAIEIDSYNDDYAFISMLVPHVKACQIHSAKLKQDENYYDDELESIGFMYERIGELEIAEKLLEKVVSKRKDAGLDDPDSLSSATLLSSIYGKRGKWSEAERQDMIVLKIVEKKYGSEHIKTILSMGHLARAYWGQGNWDKAEGLQLKVLDFCENKYGTQHEYTMSAMNDLASTYVHQGRWRKAEELQLQVVDLYKEKFGVGHRSTLGRMNDLASIYQNMGAWEKAQALCSQVMEDLKQKLGAIHPDTLNSMQNLAALHHTRGNWKEAEVLYLHILEVSNDLQSPSILITMNNLALLFQDRGYWKKAEEMFLQVIAFQKNMFGVKHEYTLISMSNLALNYYKQGNFVRAEELQLEVLEVCKENMGATHPKTLISLSNLALTYERQGKEKKAQDLHLQVMEIRKTELGLNHPSTIFSISHLAMNYKQQGSWKKAGDLQLQATELAKEVFGDKHPDTLTFMGNLATIYRKQGNWKAAATLLLHVVESQKEIHGVAHTDTLLNMSNLALLYQDQEELDKAEDLQLQVMEGYMQAFGAEHPETHSSMNNLSLTYQIQKKWKKAEELQLKVVEGSREQLGPEHLDTLVAMSNLAGTYQGLEELQKAEEIQLHVMEVRNRELGSDHPDTLKVMNNLAVLYHSQQKWDDAEKLLVQAMEGYKQRLGERNPDYLMSTCNLGFFYKQNGQLNKAEMLLKPAVNDMKAIMGEAHPRTIKYAGILDELQSELHKSDKRKTAGKVKRVFKKLFS